MRRNYVAVLLIGALLALGLSWVAPAGAGEDADASVDRTAWLEPHKAVTGVPGFAGNDAGLDADEDPEEAAMFSWFFGARIAGTYVDEGEFTGFGAPNPEGCPIGGYGASFTGTQTLTAHGTQTATNNLFGGGDAADAGGGGNLQSPAHGNWKRSGWRQITLTSVIFIQGYTPDADMCKIGCPADGQIVARPTVVVDFASDYKSATATIQTDLFFDLRGDADSDGILDYLDSDGAPGFTIYGCAQWTKLPVLELGG